MLRLIKGRVRIEEVLTIHVALTFIMYFYLTIFQKVRMSWW